MRGLHGSFPRDGAAAAMASGRVLARGCADGSERSGGRLSGSVAREKRVSCRLLADTGIDGGDRRGGVRCHRGQTAVAGADTVAAAHVLRNEQDVSLSGCGGDDLPESRGCVRGRSKLPVWRNVIRNHLYQRRAVPEWRSLVRGRAVPVRSGYKISIHYRQQAA